jgi:hypothetical protein
MGKILNFEKGKHSFKVDVSALPEFINAPTDLGTIVNVLEQSSIFNRIRMMEDVKYKMPIPSFNTNATLQQITGCGLEPSGKTTPSEEVIDVVAVGTSEEYCNEELVGTWLEELLKKGLVGQNEIPEPYEILKALHLRNWRMKAENLWWNGDTASTNPELAYMDGALKLAKNNPLTQKIAPVTITASNAFATFLAMTNLIPQEAFDEGVTYSLEISRKNASFLLQNIWNDKDYNGLVQGISLADSTLDFIMPVTGIRIMSNRFLSDSEAILIPEQVTVVATDAKSDWDFVDAKYDDYNDKSKIVVKGRIGAGFSKPEYVVVMTIA